MKGLFWNSRGLLDLEHNLEFIRGILLGVNATINKLDKFNWILMVPSLPNWLERGPYDNRVPRQKTFLINGEYKTKKRIFSLDHEDGFYRKFWDIINLMGHTTRANMEGQVGGVVPHLIDGGLSILQYARNMKLLPFRNIFPLRYLGIPIHYRKKDLKKGLSPHVYDVLFSSSKGIKKYRLGPAKQMKQIPWIQTTSTC
ncbi:hypothetical protein ACJX0J_029591 [Zea mays]